MKLDSANPRHNITCDECGAPAHLVILLDHVQLNLCVAHSEQLSTELNAAVRYWPVEIDA
jgi:hypothetical protein